MSKLALLFTPDATQHLQVRLKKATVQHDLAVARDRHHVLGKMPKSRTAAVDAYGQPTFFCRTSCEVLFPELLRTSPFRQQVSCHAPRDRLAAKMLEVVLEKGPDAKEHLQVFWGSAGTSLKMLRVKSTPGGKDVPRAGRTKSVCPVQNYAGFKRCPGRALACPTPSPPSSHQLPALKHEKGNLERHGSPVQPDLRPPPQFLHVWTPQAVSSSYRTLPGPARPARHVLWILLDGVSAPRATSLFDAVAR